MPCIAVPPSFASCLTLVAPHSWVCAGTTVWSGWEYFAGSGLQFHSAGVADAIRDKYNEMKGKRGKGEGKDPQ